MTLFLLDKLAGALVALPVAILFLIIFDRKRFAKKWGWVVLFVMYINAMLVMVGVPDYKYMTWQPTINWIPFSDFSSSNILGMVLNIVMLIPFGAFLPIYFKKFRKLSVTVCAGALMSFAIEVIQLFSYRATDIDDLLMNTLGSLLGYVIGAFIIHKKIKGEEENKDILKLVVMICINVLVVIFANSTVMCAILDAMGML